MLQANRGIQSRGCIMKEITPPYMNRQPKRKPRPSRFVRVLRQIPVYLFIASVVNILVMILYATLLITLHGNREMLTWETYWMVGADVMLFTSILAMLAVNAKRIASAISKHIYGE